MSRPPVTVQIKRKATDEPVDFLRVHESNGKRQRRATDFIFTRQTPDSNTHAFPQQGFRLIKEVRRSAGSQALGAAPDNRTSNGGTSKNGTLEDEKTIKEALQNARQRRFHISRSTPHSPLPNDKIHKKTQTVFVERRPRPTSDRSTEEIVHQPPTQPEHRTRKKPGLAARDLPSTNPSIRPIRNVRLPSGILSPWDVNSTQLIAELQAFTLAEIGHSITESDKHGTPTLEPETPRSARTSRFRPKAPALRYAERHPESVNQGMEIDEPYIQDEMDDGDYIIDTYIRVSADVLNDSGKEENIGLLILDTQPDIEEFYGEDEGSDDEEGEEGEEDENAENHYTADYPDEEVASDDEYGENAYGYRNRNADDLEEFGEGFDDEEYTHSGDEERPWAKKPWMAGLA